MRLKSKCETQKCVKREKVGEEEEEEEDEKPNKCFITSAADKKEAQWLICESGGQGHRGGAGHNVTLMYASRLSAWCPVFITRPHLDVWA